MLSYQCASPGWHCKFGRKFTCLSGRCPSCASTERCPSCASTERRHPLVTYYGGSGEISSFLFYTASDTIILSTRIVVCDMLLYRYVFGWEGSILHMATVTNSVTHMTVTCSSKSLSPLSHTVKTIERALYFVASRWTWVVCENALIFGENKILEVPMPSQIFWHKADLHFFVHTFTKFLDWIFRGGRFLSGKVPKKDSCLPFCLKI